MIIEEIQEYPYKGTITREVEGHGDEEDNIVTIYKGVMDLMMQQDTQGRVLQTASYIISIPLTKDSNGQYVIPRKSDEISLTRYGETIRFEVENAEPSQLGGVSIYVTRNTW